MPHPPLPITGQALAICDLVAVARDGRRVELDAAARARIDAAHAVVARAADSTVPVYGLNTGFGSLARQRVAPEQVREIQRNLVRSHAAGVGEPLPADLTRAMMTLLLASLARGHSGVRPVVAETIAAMLNHRITPLVPSRGSVGASGDLAPLAHVALAMIGEGEVTLEGRIVPAAEAMRDAGIEPLVLDAKEGLALINGTHLMTAQAALAVADFERLFDAALVAGAMMIDACRATDAFLDDRLHGARNQAGQREVAARLRELLKGSRIIPAHKVNDPRVQDPYSLRCMPQVLGAVLDTLRHARTVVERELGAVTDNPLVFPAPDGSNGAGDIVSGGNFHGLPLALVMDSLKIAIAHLAGISERRVFFLLSARDPENPVPAYLSPSPGLHSGYMIAQYTAAACCNEIQALAAPASVANIPTSAGQEDYNSFGPTAGFQLRRALELAQNVVAIELLCAAEGLEYQRPLTSGEGVERAHAALRRRVARLDADRPPAPDVKAIALAIREGAFGRNRR